MFGKLFGGRKTESGQNESGQPSPANENVAEPKDGTNAQNQPISAVPKGSNGGDGASDIKAKEAANQNFPNNDDDDVDFGETSPEFAYLWDDPAAFKEETFYKNFTASRKWTDIQWTIIFWINFIITVVLFILADPSSTDNFQGDASNLSMTTVATVGLVSIAIAFVIVFLTSCAIWFCPRAYVRYAAIANIIITAATLIPAAWISSPYFLIFGGLILLYVVVTAVFKCKKIAFSACVMNASALILREYPTIFVFNLIMFVVQSAINYVFSTGALLAWADGYSYGLYVYIVFSYYFITGTLSYVTYNICAGVAASWYFLHGSEYEIPHPILYSTKNAIGPNFGPCSLAGILESVSKVFEFLEEQGKASPCCCCMACFKCCCNCMLCMFKCIVGAITKYSLIYCAMFGVPAKEGVKRWAKTKKIKMVKQVVNSTIITTTFDFYKLCASVVGTSVASLIAQALYDNGSPEMIFMSTMGAFFALSGMSLISQPIIVLSDTLFIGFGEAPQRLETGAKPIYDLFDDESKEIMEKEIIKAKGEDTGCFGC